MQLVHVSALGSVTSTALRHPSTLITVGQSVPYPKNDCGLLTGPRVMHADKARLPTLLAALSLAILLSAGLLHSSEPLHRQAEPRPCWPAPSTGYQALCPRSRPPCAALSSLCCFLQRFSWARAWPGAVRVCNPTRAMDGPGVGGAQVSTSPATPQIARLCLALLLLA